MLSLKQEVKTPSGEGYSLSPIEPGARATDAGDCGGKVAPL